MTTTRLPFQQGRFRDLPEKPSRPHHYFDVRGERVEVAAPEFGTNRAYVKIHGSGPPLLLLHGLMTSSYSWRYVLEPLGRHFTLYMPDLPGNGDSEPLAVPYHPETLAIWIGALQRALGIRGCAVVGNSMGGYLCMRLALRDPESMSRIINVHSPGVRDPRLYALRAALGIPFAKRVLAWWVRRDPHRWAFRNVHYYDETLKSLEEAREYGRPLATKEGSIAFVQHLAETMAIGPVVEFQRTLEARLARGERFPIPMLLLFAARDPMVPARFGDELARRIPDAKFARLEQASHFAHVDAVERFLPPVLEFLGASDAPRVALVG